MVAVHRRVRSVPVPPERVREMRGGAPRPARLARLVDEPSPPLHEDLGRLAAAERVAAQNDELPALDVDLQYLLGTGRLGLGWKAGLGLPRTLQMGGRLG